MDDTPTIVFGVALYGCRWLMYVDDAMNEVPTTAMYPYRDGFMTHPDMIERMKEYEAASVA